MTNARVRRRARLACWAVAAALAVAAVAVARRTTPAEVRAAAGGAPAPAAPAPAGSVAAASTPAATAVELPVLRPGPAPTIRGATGFIGIDRLTDADLVGKVVLYDFWTFECINCQHTLSHLLAWQARYAPDGLLIVGIHTPEFAAEADPANVRRYVGEQRITWPVVLDADHHVWDAWDNGYWPEFYLHDELGRRRLVHIGEGAYDEVEDAIRALLHVDPASPRAVVTS